MWFMAVLTVFLDASCTYYALTVATQFQNAAEEFGWPSLVRGENAIVASMMVQVRGDGRGSFIAGSSPRHLRIERLWCEVFRCVIFLFYCMFYALEESVCLDLENDKEIAAVFNHRPTRTDKIWINGMTNPDNEGQPAVRDPAITEAVPENIDLYGVDRDGPLPVERQFHKTLWICCNRLWIHSRSPMCMGLIFTCKLSLFCKM